MPDPHDDSRSGVMTRSQTRALPETIPEGGSSGQESAKVNRDAKVLDSDLRKSGASLTYEALQASDDSPIGKDVDSVGAGPTSNADVPKSPYNTV